MILDPILDFFRGKAVTIPPLDGAFRPNTRLDDARQMLSLPAADNLVVVGKDVMASSGNAVFTLSVDAPVLVETHPAPVTALAVSPDHELAVALETGVLSIGGATVDLPDAVRCITALEYGRDGTLWLANGSAIHPPSAWAADLMGQGSSGSVWKREPGAGSFREVASGLAFPYGLYVESSDIVVSESWRHRLVGIDASGDLSVLVDKLPGYPARMTPTPDGGAWLSIFAPRNRLIEFVLQEKHYRKDMLETVSPAYWIAPSLSSGRSFLEPLQCGGIKTMGVHKPWSPSRSYGMVVRLDPTLRALSSLHSRANGQRHGVCSALEHAGRLFVASRGGDCVLTIDLEEEYSHG